MGFWSWLVGDDDFDPDADLRIRDDQNEVTPPVSDVLLKALLNNEVITREKALTLPAVSGAVDFISGSIASMPVKLYKVRDGKVEEQSKDTRVRLLNGDTGDTLDAFQMKKAMVEDYLLGKGGYAYIERKRNDVISLRYVEDRYITVLKNFKPIFKDFEIMVEGQSYKPYEFIKLLRNTKDGASGIGLTVEVAKALETAYQTMIYQLGTVKSGGNKKGFLKANRRLAQEEINALKTAWTNLYANSSENVVVLNNGLEFQEASNSSVDMQLDQNKKTLGDEINDIFHIYPNDFDRTFKESIYPIVKAFETALNRDLLLEKEKKNHFFELDVKEIIKANLKDRYESYKLAKETGFMTLNEIRRAENLNWIEGLDVVNVGLGAVLYDTNKGVYYTPNTDTVGNIGQEDINKMLEGHELAEAYDESGNSAERSVEERYNDVHDENGRFGTKGGSSGGGSGSGSSGGAGGSPESNLSSGSSGGSGNSKPPKEKADDWYLNKLTESQQSVIAEMSINTSNLNRYLYDEDFRNSLSDAQKQQFERKARVAKSALSKYELEKPITTYRGVSDDEFTNTLFGDDANKSFKSSSYDKSRAEAFAKNQGGGIIEYRIKKGNWGADVNGVPMANEGEFLINKDVPYKIISSKGKYMIIEIGE